MKNLLSIILLDPDTYIYIGWGLLAVLTIIVAIVCWRTRRRWLRVSLLLPLLLLWYVFLYGTYIGFKQLEVVRVELAFSDLPEAFDGYKIVQFSDLHLGTCTGSRKDIVQRVVDSINAQHADVVVYTGDLKNKEPSEIEPFLSVLETIEAKDGVFSVLGNHDYAIYLKDPTPVLVAQNQGKTENYEEDMGWTLLMNSRKRIWRDSSDIVIAGMQNDGEPGGRFPQLGDINYSLYGIRRNEFVVMLEHDPSSWRRKILPHSHVQLTLSGHTHGGQFSLLGLSPAAFVQKEYDGLYWAGERALYVSKGIGGVVPFRFGTPPEIVVFTLKIKK